MAAISIQLDTESGELSLSVNGEKFEDVCSFSGYFDSYEKEWMFSAASSVTDDADVTKMTMVRADKKTVVKENALNALNAQIEEFYNRKKKG